MVQEFLSKMKESEEHSAAYNQASSLDDVAYIAKKMGYNITTKELQDYYSSTEMDESDLEKVTGGTSMMGAGRTSAWYSGD